LGIREEGIDKRREDRLNTALGKFSRAA